MASAATLTLVQTLRDHFDKNEVSRQELLKYFLDHGKNYIPYTLYKLNVGNATFRLDTSLFDTAAQKSSSPKVAMARPAVTESRVVNLTEAREVTIDAGKNFDSSKLIPKLDPNFVPYGQYAKIKKILNSNRFFPVYLTGPTGVGKSTMIKHICASTGRKFARVVITKDTTDEDLFGRKTLVEGNVVWEDGIMTLAAEMGFPIVLDEISAGNPSNLFGLYTILEGDRHFCKDGNKFVEPRAGFNIICTDNTLGRGDETGQYVGTNILNEAMLDRFKIALHQPYPNEKIETTILTNYFNSLGLEVNQTITTFAENIAKWAGLIRTAQEQGAIDDAVSTRRLIVIAEHFSIFGKELEAIQDACTRFGPTTQAAFVDYYTKLVGGGTVDSVLGEASNQDTDDLF